MSAGEVVMRDIARSGIVVLVTVVVVAVTMPKLTNRDVTSHWSQSYDNAALIWPM